MNWGINLLSGPRNISTALMYSFAQHSKVKVIDEPFYAHYLKITGIDHPGRNETLASMSSDFDEIISKLDLKKKGSSLFLKNMAHHVIDMPMDWLLDYKNVFLIRSPEFVIASYIKNLEYPNIDDLGYKRAYELKEFLSKNNQDFIIMESEEILKNPKESLSKICNFAGLDFEKSMLQWEAGPRIEDGAWAEYWYANVHRSTGFESKLSKTPKIPERLNPLLEECEKFYGLLKS